MKLTFSTLTFFVIITIVTANERITPQDLVQQSPVIALISVEDSPIGRIHDASYDLSVQKQRAQGKRISMITGSLPEYFIIENQKDSILTNGTFVAFLKKLSDRRYILSTPFSLRRVKDNQVYWIPPGYRPLKLVFQEITLISLNTAEQGAAANP